MTLQEATQQVVTWGISIAAGACITGATYAYPILVAVTDQAWEKLASEVPGLVVTLILCTIFIRYLGGKIDKLTEAVTKMDKSAAVHAEAAKNHCKFRIDDE